MVAAGAKGNVAGQGAGSAAVRPNPDEKPAAVTTAPDGKGPPAVPLTQANLAPEKYQGQVVVIDHALLFGGVVGRGGNYELQVLFENERKPSNLAFPVTRLGVVTAVKYLRGEKVEKRIDTGVSLITRDNMGQPAMKELLYPPIDKYLK